MPFSIQIDAYGETLVHRELMRFSENLMHPQHALQVAANVLRVAAREQFDTHGAASGGWAALKAATLEQKRRHGYPPDILHATGALERSLVSKFDPRHVERLSGDSLTFGSAVTYGRFHATGTRKMPRRPPLALSDAMKVRLVKDLQAALLGGVTAGSQNLGLAA